jgi:hypothetical protein
MHRHPFGVRFLLFCLGLFALVTPLTARAAASSAATGDVIYETTFASGELTWRPVPGGGVAAELSGARLAAVPGQPLLPARHLLLLVPSDRAVARVLIEPLATHKVIAPAAVAVAGDATTSEGGRLTAADYAKGGARDPDGWLISGSAHLWRGYQLVSVAVAPLRPTGDDPTVCEFLDAYAVRVVWADGPVPEPVVRERLVPGENEDNQRLLERVLDNPSALATVRRENGVAVAAPKGDFRPEKTPSLTGSPVSCLIITSQALAASFQVLADYRTALGLPTVVATTEYISANYRHGSDLQETMRLFIRDAYQKWGLQYVLLGGDSGILPPRIVNNPLYPPNSYTAIPCDLYFACLDGNWNANPDGNYGQAPYNTIPGDQADFADEVYLGRAPVNTVAQANLFVQKTIAYESLAAGTAWPNRVLFAAEVLFPEDYHAGDTIYLDGASFADEQISTAIAACTDMQYSRMYEATGFPRDLPLSRTAFIDSLNSGHFGIVNQIGHGYFFNMSVGDANFMSADADNLTNGGHQFLLYGLNCASAAFDNSCVMERFLQNANGGAVAALGSTREAFAFSVNSYQQEFFQKLYCDGENRAGRLMALSRLPFLAGTDLNTMDRWTYENYVLLGDPALALWSAPPRTATVTAPASVAAGERSVSVTVTVGATPVAGALVCLAKPGEDLVWGTTNAAGQATLTILAPSAGTITLKVSGHDLATVTRSIPVTISGRYLKITGMPFTDNGTGGSVGNGNGVIDAGERIAFTPTYLNTGTSAGSSLRGALTTTTPGVTVVTASVALNNAAAGGTTTAQAPILVDFASSLPDGRPITFRSDAYSGTTHWYSEYTVPLNAPEPSVTALDWQDTSWGNGNGRLDNGERVGITIDVKNYGVGASGQLTGRLRAASPNVVLYDTLATWTSLGLLGHGLGSAPFSLALTDTASSGAAWVLLRDGYGRQVRHDFTLKRPAAPSGLLASTELGPDTIALSWAPSTSADTYGYDIYRAPAATGPWTRVNTDVVAGVAAYTDTGLPLLTPFHYRVVTVDSSRVPSTPSLVISRSTAPAEAEGFPAPFLGETSGPLAVGDIDGNGSPEVVLASGQVYAWHNNGIEVRDGDGQGLTVGQFSDFPSGTLLELSAVTMANLDGLAGQEFIVSERSPTSRVHVFRANGSELAGWPRSLGGLGGTTFNWAAPAVGDIDGDQAPEIVVNSLNGVVWAWNADGTEVRDGDNDPATQGVLYIRPGATWEWSRSGPTLVDLDHDGARDIVFGTKSDASGQKRLMALRWNGTTVPGFPRVINGAVSCDIAAGDLDHDGEIELVLFDSWRYVYAIRHDGTDYPGFPRLLPYAASAEWPTSPALGDLDGDGWLEIVYAPNESGLLSRLVAVSTKYTDGTSGLVRPGWPVELPGSSEASPVIGDLDGDGTPEVVQGIGGGDVSAPNNLYAFHANGTPMNGFPITLTGPVRASPVITDLDGDLDVDLVYGGWDGKAHVWALPFAHHAAKGYWPTYKGNQKRDGTLSSPGAAAVDPGRVPAAPLALDLPYPNPFNPSVSVRLYLDDERPVKLVVHDLRGHRVRALYDGRAAAGWRTVVWDGRDDAGRAVASGVYFLRAESPGATPVTRKLALVR